MKRAEYLDRNIKTIVEEYNNFKEFCAVQNNRPLVWDTWGEPTRDEKYDSDKRCDTFEEAQNFLLYGFEENVNEMVSAVGQLQKTGTRTRKQLYADVVGFAPIVPNAILGVPNSMMNVKKKQIKTKVVTINYDPTVPWHVSPQEVLGFGCRFINCVLNLERRGYRVKINYLATAGDGTRQYILRIPLKSEHNPLNIKRMSFPITHIAMLRYLFMDWEERLPKSDRMSGHGHPLYVADANEKENFNEVMNDGSYLVTFGTDIETMFKQIDAN